MAVHIHKALDVDEAMMQGVDLWHEERQGTELRPFGGEELPRAGVQMPFGVAFTLSQKARAWPLRSARSVNVRPARKLCSRK